MRMWMNCYNNICVTTINPPGPVWAEDPSSKRCYCIQATPTQMNCPQHRSRGRNVLPTHRGGCICKIYTYKWLKSPLRHTMYTQYSVISMYIVSSYYYYDGVLLNIKHQKESNQHWDTFISTGFRHWCLATLKAGTYFLFGRLSSVWVSI